MAWCLVQYKDKFTSLVHITLHMTWNTVTFSVLQFVSCSVCECGDVLAVKFDKCSLYYTRVEE